MKRLILFLVLSAADLILTTWLLTTSGAWVYEANPVAGWFLKNLDWPGFVGFKLATVAAVLVCVGLIAPRRPRLAGTILTLGCGTLALVLAYSGYSAVTVTDWTEVVREHERHARFLSARHETTNDYADLRRALSSDLIGGRFALTAAVHKLEGTSKAKDANWMGVLRELYQSDSVPATLASDLLQEVRLTLSGRAGAADILRRLRGEFRTEFGTDPVLPPLPAELSRADADAPRPAAAAAAPLAVPMPRPLDNPAAKAPAATSTAQ